MEIEELIRIIKMIFKGEMKVFVKQIRAQKCSGVIYVPRNLRDKKAIVLIENEDQGTNTSGPE